METDRNNYTKTRQPFSPTRIVLAREPFGSLVRSRRHAQKAEAIKTQVLQELHAFSTSRIQDYPSNLTNGSVGAPMAIAIAAQMP